MKKTSSHILQELDSDDELPNCYNDISVLPAYLDDNRFDKIKFPWLNNVDSNYSNQSKSLFNHYHDEILRHEGVLRCQDLYCLKSVESFTCSNTLIWFVNFLLRKDLHSNYCYLKSCLVNDIITTIPLSKITQGQREDIVNKDRYEIVIKVGLK